MCQPGGAASEQLKRGNGACEQRAPGQLCESASSPSSDSPLNTEQQISSGLVPKERTWGRI